MIDRPRKTLRCRRASLAPVADRERCLHLMIKKGEGRRECGVYTQIGGVQQGSVNRLFQRRNRTVFQSLTLVRPFVLESAVCL